MKYLVVILLSLTSVVYGQNLRYKAPKTGEVVVNEDGLVITARVYLKNKKVRTKPDRFYHWYKSDKIFKTEGGFDGRLLHGVVATFYPSKNLKSKGEFKYGLKKGEWLSWYKNGTLKKVVKWRKGRKNGRFSEYGKDGDLIKTGSYRDDQLHGIITEYEDSVMTKYKYKKGELVKEIPVKNRAGKEKGAKKKGAGTVKDEKVPFYKKGWNKVKQWFKKKDKPEKEKKKKDQKEDRQTKKEAADKEKAAGAAQ